MGAVGARKAERPPPAGAHRGDAVPVPVPGGAGTKRIGQILIQEGITDTQTEQRAAAIQAGHPGRKFGEILGIVPHFGYRRTEISYSRLTAVEDLIARIGPLKNAFLEQVKDASVPMDLGEAEKEDVDEAAMDAEINQSMLTNLVEGCLVEAVRQGASDIHIVPLQASMSN